MNYRKSWNKLAGHFTRTEWTPEFSVIKFVGPVWAHDLTASDIEFIKGFYQYPSDAPHEIINNSENGALKISAVSEA